MTTSKELSADSLTESQKKQVLLRVFEKDIQAFGEFFFPHHLSLATPKFHQELYRLYESDLTMIGIAAPRGHAKSTITDLVYLAWEIVHKHRHFVLVVSDTYTQSTLFLGSLKVEFEGNERLREFYGNLVSDKWSESEIVVDGIMVKAVGAGMKVRGLKYGAYRPDLILIDDLENDELVESKERREKLEYWFNKALVPSLQKGGRVVMIGTILHYDSLLSKVLSADKYLDFTKRLYKAISDTGALWPEHLDLVELDRIKRDYVNNGLGFVFYQEYQNDPISGEYRKFKIEKFQYITEAQEAQFQAMSLNTYITIDRAYSTDKTADATGIVVNSVDRENKWYVRSAERFKGTEGELIQKIFDLHLYWKPIKFGIEQKAFLYTLKPALEDEMRKRNQFFSVEELKDLGINKNVRIEGLVPRFESGSIFFRREQTDLVDELITFPKGIHDDLIDALAYQLSLAVAANPLGNQTQQKIPEPHYGKRYLPPL